MAHVPWVSDGLSYGNRYFCFNAVASERREERMGTTFKGEGGRRVPYFILVCFHGNVQWDIPWDVVRSSHGIL